MITTEHRANSDNTEHTGVGAMILKIIVLSNIISIQIGTMFVMYDLIQNLKDSSLTQQERTQCKQEIATSIFLIIIFAILIGVIQINWIT